MSYVPDPKLLADVTAACMARNGKQERGEIRFTCPSHSPDEHPSARFNARKACWTCDVCGGGGGIIDLVALLGIDVPRARSRRAHHNNGTHPSEQSKDSGQNDDANAKWGRKVWINSELAKGTVVETYFASRGITHPIPSTIRFHKKLKHAPSGEFFPAMIAAVFPQGVEGSTGSIFARDPDEIKLSIHRTYLALDGSGKATVDPAKMSCGPVSGGAVRLGDLRAGEPLLIGEGIETVLSCMQATGLPGWAAISCVGIENLDALLDEIKDIIITADNDSEEPKKNPGMESARAAALRWVLEGRRVRIAKPPVAGQDFNDILREQGEQAIRDIVAAAEEIRDPLEGLVERCAETPGAAYEPEVLERLRTLRENDRPAFQTLRVRLKRETDVGVTTLDEQLNFGEGGGGEGGERESQADILVGIARANAELFCTPDSTSYADVKVSGRRETWAVRSKGFKRWLVHGYCTQEDSAPNSEALSAALNAIDADATYNGLERKVFTRAGNADGKIYIDLADKKWHAIEIDADGWRIIDEPPVRFRRAPGMLPLPEPTRGGSVLDLGKILNVKTIEEATDAQGRKVSKVHPSLMLTIAWLLAALRDKGPFPILTFTGEQGTGKSWASRIVRSLVDPNVAALRTLPKEERDLYITANNGHVLAGENLSYLPAWLSDSLCRFSTGGGHATRELFTDDGEKIFDAMKPIVLNGITNVVTRSDLADRALLVELEPITEDRRRTDEEVQQAIEEKGPGILGALLNAMSRGLRELPKTKGQWPRMADFTKWIVACETALPEPWKSGDFVKTYGESRTTMVEDMLAADVLAVRVRELVGSLPLCKPARTEWRGTATELLETLFGKNAGAANEDAGADGCSKASAPEEADDSGLGGSGADGAAKRGTSAKASLEGYTPRTLANRLRRIAPPLRTVGVCVAFERIHGVSYICFSQKPKRTGDSSAPSAPAAPAGAPNDAGQPGNGNPGGAPAGPPPEDNGEDLPFDTDTGTADHHEQEPVPPADDDEDLPFDTDQPADPAAAHHEPGQDDGPPEGVPSLADTQSATPKTVPPADGFDGDVEVF